jgi:hypothetical protein
MYLSVELNGISPDSSRSHTAQVRLFTCCDDAALGRIAYNPPERVLNKQRWIAGEHPGCEQVYDFGVGARINGVSSLLNSPSGSYPEPEMSYTSPLPIAERGPFI